MQLTQSNYNILYPNDIALITGASGFLGYHVVSKLIEHGHTNIRCIIRSPEDKNKFINLKRDNRQLNFEVLQGDLIDWGFVLKATKGVKVIYHLAAGADGKSYAGAFLKSVITTKHLIEASLFEKKLKRFVNIGSFSSYCNKGLNKGELLDESCPIVSTNSPFINPYTFAKTEQDKLVMQYGIEKNLPWVILRPGAIYGPGAKELITSRVGIDTFGIFFHLGNKNILPLTYVENCAEAVVLAGIKPDIDKNIFNIVDDDLPESRDFLSSYKKYASSFISLKVPYFCFYVFSYLWEKYSIFSKGQIPLVFNRRRTYSMWRGNTYTNLKAKKMLGWSPSIKYKEARMNYFKYIATIRTKE